MFCSTVRHGYRVLLEDVADLAAGAQATLAVDRISPPEGAKSDRSC
jgi:hypothetical protein